MDMFTCHCDMIKILALIMALTPIQEHKQKKKSIKKKGGECKFFHQIVKNYPYLKYDEAIDDLRESRSKYFLHPPAFYFFSRIFLKVQRS